MIADQDEINERFKPNLELMKSISEVPKNWSIEFDEDLAELLKDVVNTDMPGSIRNLIKSISVSTQRVSSFFNLTLFYYKLKNFLIKL